MKKKDYVGESLNGWLILEELPPIHEESWSQQRVHNNRRFRVKNEADGYICERNIAQMRKNSHLIKPEERVNFRDLTGSVISHYKVLHLKEESKLPTIARKNKSGLVWICIDTRTNERVEKTSTSLLYLKPCSRHQHGARGNTPDETDKILYKLWQAIKQKCHSPACTGYKHFGAKGMTMCETWQKEYIEFKKCILNEIGIRPSRHYTLFIKKGKEYRPGNVEWVKIRSSHISVTDPSQYGNRLLH